MNTFVGKLSECVRWLRAKVAEYEERERHMGREPDELLFKVMVWKRKRSLSQNAYYWVLLNKLGLTLGYASDELHGHMLREYGVYDVFTVRDDVPLNDYFRYWDEVGSGFMDGVKYRHVRAFKGSSEMDSTEFSKLLNGVIQECQQQGIETMTPQDAAKLMWYEGVA